MICNVRTWLFLCLHIYTHGGLYGHTDNESAQNIFDLEKLSIFFLELLTGFEPQVFGSRVRRSSDWTTPLPAVCHRQQRVRPVRIPALWTCSSCPSETPRYLRIKTTNSTINPLLTTIHTKFPWKHLLLPWNENNSKQHNQPTVSNNSHQISLKALVITLEWKQQQTA